MKFREAIIFVMQEICSRILQHGIALTMHMLVRNRYKQCNSLDLENHRHHMYYFIVHQRKGNQFN